MADNENNTDSLPINGETSLDGTASLTAKGTGDGKDNNSNKGQADGTGGKGPTGVLSSGFNFASTELPPPEQDLIDELKEKLTFFFWMAQFCIWIHWIVGLTGTVSATLAA